MYAWVCVCVYILCKWWWNCSFCCCQNGNEKTHTQAKTHHSSSSDGHRKQSDKVKKKVDASCATMPTPSHHGNGGDTYKYMHMYILTPRHTCMATTALALVLCSLQWSNTCWNLIGNNYNTEWGCCCCCHWGGASIKSVYLRIGAAAASAGALLWWWWKWKPCNYRFLFGALTALRIGGEGSVSESIQIRREGESESKIDDGAFTCTAKENNNKYVKR